MPFNLIIPMQKILFMIKLSQNNLQFCNLLQKKKSHLRDFYENFCTFQFQDKNACFSHINFLLLHVDAMQLLSLLFYYLHGPRAFVTGPLGCQPHVDEQFQEADQQLMLILCSLHIGGNVSQRVDNWLGHLSVRNKSSSVSF